jgi:hypothetical protein
MQVRENKTTTWGASWNFKSLYTILYKNEFQNPPIFHLHVRFSLERSTFVIHH